MVRETQNRVNPATLLPIQEHKLNDQSLEVGEEMMASINGWRGEDNWRKITCQQNQKNQKNYHVRESLYVVGRHVSGDTKFHSPSHLGLSEEGYHKSKDFKLCIVERMFENICEKSRLSTGDSSSMQVGK